MVPELTAYRKHEIFTHAEIGAIVKRREFFERQIQDSYCPSVKTIVDYVYQLHSTYKLVCRRWTKRGNNINDLFSQAYEPLKRISGVISIMLNAHRADSNVWETAIQLLHKIGIRRKLNTTIGDYVSLHPSEAEPWIYAATYAEEAISVARARKIYQQASKIVSGCVLPRVNPRKLKIIESYDAAQTSHDTLPLHSPAGRIIKLHINWVLLEMRHLSALRGSRDSEKYLSDFLVDHKVDKTSSMRPVLQGRLAEIVLRNGMLSILMSNLSVDVPESLRMGFQHAYEASTHGQTFGANEWKLTCIGEPGLFTAVPVVQEFLVKAYAEMCLLVESLGWVSWWPARAIIHALEDAWSVVDDLRSKPDYIAVVRNHSLSKSDYVKNAGMTADTSDAEALQLILQCPTIGDYSEDPFLNSDRAVEPVVYQEDDAVNATNELESSVSLGDDFFTETA